MSIQHNHILDRQAKQITGFETQAERSPGDLADEEIALLEPAHVAAVYLLGADRTVRLPCVIAHQMASQYFVSHPLQPTYDRAGGIERGPVASHREPEVDLHALKVPHINRDSG